MPVAILSTVSKKESAAGGSGQPHPHERRRGSPVPYTDEGKAAGLAASDLSSERLTGLHSNSEVRRGYAVVKKKYSTS